jgi:hypothetical protein
MATQKELIKQVLDRLRDALGTGETPPNSNHNFITIWYNNNVAKIGDGPWCEMTNTWAMWTGGCKEIKSGRAYTVYATHDAISEINGSSWHYGTKGMRAGDEVYYDWSGKKGNATLVDHTGTVEKIIGDGTFYVLEGNSTANLLRRQRRDGTFVVGYTRLAWGRLDTVPPKPAPPRPVTKPKPDVEKTKRVQKTLEVSPNGHWDHNTDVRAQTMRTASRAHAGYPKKINKRFNIELAQKIIDTNVDGIWGFRSQASIFKWVKTFQTAVGVKADGQWGPKTDNAYLAVRKHNLNNF